MEVCGDFISTQPIKSHDGLLGDLDTAPTLRLAANFSQWSLVIQRQQQKIIWHRGPECIFPSIIITCVTLLMGHNLSNTTTNKD